MKRVVLISGHPLRSPRRAGFHWLAEAYTRLGWDVLFITASISRLSRLRRDRRLACLSPGEAGRLRALRPGLWSFVWYTAWHPANLRLGLLNRLTSGWFARYGDLPLGEAEPWVRQADLVIFESTPGMMLLPQVRRLSPQARCVYRVSDDMRVLRNHPAVLEAEERLAGAFDLVSVPSPALLQRFGRLPRAALHHHGIARELFDRPHEDPYGPGPRPRCVFVGSAMFDRDFLARASAALPEWVFHVIGPVGGLPRRPNVVGHGERPFAETVPFLLHADIGLQTLVYTPGAECFTDSLKVLQYTWCRLPIVAPEFLRCGREHMFHYRPGDTAGIVAALRAADAFDRRRIGRDGIRSWEELAATLADEGG